MRVKFSGLLSLFLLFLFTQTTFATKTIEALAQKALSAEVAESAPAIAELRGMGPAGLDALIETYQAEITRQTENPALANTAEWRRLAAALDAVSQQKDSYLSGLYWYTDFAAAKRAAQASGKPILSLRLLGKLNEEFSCANSRFFRTVLYSNAEISKALRERFILHWQSVRAVPRITIDFGDGRKLERTITGNSIHYILDPEGRPIDALPGLYGPAAFMRGLADAEQVFKQLDGKDAPARNFLLNSYHRARAGAISVAWLNDTTKIGGKIPEGVTVRRGTDGQALQVMPLAVTKAVTETSMLRSMNAGAEALGRITDESAWTRIAMNHILDAKLDERSLGLIQRQTRDLFTAEDGSGLKPERKLINLVQKLQLSIALDSVRNEYLLHTKLHAWLVTDPRRDDVDALNEKVYAELFLMPRSDPWLGLFSAEAYTGLENGGVVRRN